jgi:DNA/RNA endonuclease G (NUC1)
MRLARPLSVATLTFAVACSGRDALAPAAPTTPRLDVSAAAVPSVYLSEIHYDNTGTDVDEKIEINGPAGMDLTGWQVVLYNGTGGASYDTKTLSGTVPATCDTRGVIVLTYPSNGIQNGSPDGVALVNAGGQVVEFLSYEGTFAATNGPALGTTSVDIGVSEAGTEPTGQSLQRSSGGTWTGPATNTFGACNDDGTPPPPPVVAKVTVAPATAAITVGATQQFTATALDASNQPIAGVTFTWSTSAPAVATVSANGLATAVATGDATITASAPNAIGGTAALHVDPATTPTLPPTRFSEIHYDNFGTDAGEAIEIEAAAGTDVTGWTIVLYNGNGGVTYNTQTLSGSIPATCTARGVMVVNYPQDGIQNGSPDGMALVNASGQVVEFLSYEGTFTATNGPAAGILSTDIGALENSAPVGQSLQRDANGVWSLATSTFGACNPTSGTPGGTTISFSGRLPGDVPLPVGFQDQLFATVRGPGNVVIPTTVTWTSETPAVASIDQNGVITALAAGSATLRATTADGLTTNTITLPTRVAVLGGTAQYGNNTEFGDPADADASDDFILRHLEYTSSYNKNRGTPNWVAYDLDASHFGPEDRCDCFTFDPDLPASFPRYTTADYTGAGDAAGFGIDRGHLARSFDRTSGSLDNAFTFLFSNIVPQASDLNQGPWANMENFLGDLARLQNKEVYIVAGVAGNKGTIKNEGKIVIPAFTWKVAVIMPRDKGLADVTSVRDLEVIAAVMPNVAGIRNVDWNTYRTTVDSVEKLSGYDLLALLRDDIEIEVESGDRPPVAEVNGPFSSQEGSPVSMSGATSSDPDGDALTYLWSFGDGATGSGPTATHTYVQDGSYTVRLIVRDPLGLADTVMTTAAVSNVAPTIATLGGATLVPGETYSAAGSFTDPGADSWTATVDYGDGSGVNPLGLTGKTFALTHVYTAAGTFTVTVRVADDDVETARSATVTVLTPAQAVGSAIALVDALATGGKIDAGNANSLRSKLDNAQRSLETGNTNAASGQLRALLNEIDALLHSDRVSASDVDALRALIARVIDSIA